jgi:hypothetical protein
MNHETRTKTTTSQSTLTVDEYVRQLPENVLRALNLWQSLSSEERADVLKAYDAINELPESVQSQLRKYTVNVTTRPYGTKCDYCGRG